MFGETPIPKMVGVSDIGRKQNHWHCTYPVGSWHVPQHRIDEPHHNVHQNQHCHMGEEGEPEACHAARGVVWPVLGSCKTFENQTGGDHKEVADFFFVTEHRANTGFDASLMMWHSTVMNETKLCSEHPNVVSHGKTVTIPATNQPGVILHHLVITQVHKPQLRGMVENHD